MINFTLDLNGHHARRALWIILPAIAVVAILGALLALRSDAVVAALAPYLSKQSGVPNELYFSDYKSMPKLVDPGKSYPVDFTIVNHAGQDRAFGYRVTIVEDSVTKTSSGNTAMIPVGQPARQRITFFPTQPGKKIRVIIEIPELNQLISYSAQIGFK